jgi:thioredoxin-related protein
MKYILTCLVFFMLGHSASASDTTIPFRQIKYADLFETAKKENKGVMLYFHFDGCGACVTMERTAFKDKSVIDYYNTHFINFEINTLKGDGIEINKIYNIKTHPTFIYFDKAGNEVHRIVGAFSPEDFSNHANNALFSGKSLINYKKQYNAGNRTPDFLFDYVNLLRDANELDSVLINEYLITQNAGNLYEDRNIKFIYEYIVHQGKGCMPYGSREYLFMAANKNLFARFFDPEQVATRLMLIVSDAAYEAIEKKDTIAFFQAIESLKEYDWGKEYNYKEMDGRITIWTTTKTLVLSAKMSFYEKLGDGVKYNECLQQYIEKIWNDADELNSFAWSVFSGAKNDEKEKIQTAIKCSIRSIELNNNYANNDTYAWLLYKSGSRKKAVKQANKAIEIARKNNQDFSETQKLIDAVSKKE